MVKNQLFTTSYYPRSSTETQEGYNLTLPFVVFSLTISILAIIGGFWPKCKGVITIHYIWYHGSIYNKNILLDNQSMSFLVKACWYTMFLVFLVLSHKMVMFLFSPHLDRATYSWPWENISESCSAMPETLTVWPGKKCNVIFRICCSLSEH